MCATCGCSGEAPKFSEAHDHAHGGHEGEHPAHRHHENSHHDHDHHDHDHGAHGRDDRADRGAPERSAPSASRTIRLEQDLLAKNALLAERNRGWLEAKRITAWNLVSSPGAGKTTLLERTIRDLAGEVPISVIEGDQETALDAERIRATGCPVIQINTGSGCHLDAAMVASALRRMDPPSGSILMIENVGNLVCPALFDLGERGKAVIMSVTEGEDKPLKYPHMFRASRVLVLNKIDLLPYVGFDVERCVGWARQVNPRLSILQVSATHGDGLEQWYAWLRSQATDLSAEISS
jgi:hydrogenase nickel incorporation protein HypB